MQNKNSFIFSIISDTHVLAKELMVDNKDFETFTKFDRKLLVESEALLERSLELVSEKNTSYLLLTGDLTKDGEKLSHKRVSQILRAWKNEDEKRKIFILPGNHDINNSKSYDYKNNSRAENISPKDFLDIYDFTYQGFDKIEMYKDSQIFKSYLNKVNEAYKRESNAMYYAHGFLSYMARIKQENKDTNGISIIALDTSIYSCDFENNHLDFKENVPGYLEENQMIWALDMIDAAKKRKDLIIMIAHHAIIPNFRNQELVFAPFIIKNWARKYKSEDPRLNDKTPIEVLADRSVKFIFTGHLHENGTAKFKSQAGNEIFNIQTGSIVTYPLPIRHIKIVDDVEDFSGFSLDVKTQFIKDFTFINLKGNVEIVTDATYYTLENQLSLKDVVFNYVKTQANKPEIYNINLKNEILKYGSTFLKRELPRSGYINEIFPLLLKYFPKAIKNVNISITVYKKDFAFLIRFMGSRIIIRSASIERALENMLRQIEDKIISKEYIIDTYELLVRKFLSMPLDENSKETIYDFSNYLYQYKALDEEERPLYIEKFINKLNNPNYNIIDQILSYTKDEINSVYDHIFSSIVFKKDGSKSKFYNDLLISKGLAAKITIFMLEKKLNNLKDLINLLARPLFGKKQVEGVDLLSYIIHHRKFTSARYKYTSKMFGTKSLRKYIIDLIMSMSNEVIDRYQNEDFNELDHYFNYIEYDESKI
ncbi:MAG: metallophosphoesterase [Peptoniphilaceae bacterium]|nr:metallophosphoesterase [Peptoniphilaceae bacterium]MDY6018200.1 metallophosphoesterase [Anaerococcus sp.]